jgi:hypothetical protein
LAPKDYELDEDVDILHITEAFQVYKDQTSAQRVEEIEFDKKLVERKNFNRQDESAQRRYEIDQKYLWAVKYLIVMVYFFVTPYLLAPKWCMQYMHEND